MTCDRCSTITCLKSSHHRFRHPQYHKKRSFPSPSPVSSQPTILLALSPPHHLAKWSPRFSHGYHVGWRGPVTGRSAEQSG
eukprot:1141012-Pelagomonas_calceolata.AAC.3